ncbi:hypothetical protein RYX36_005529 [Vicia faba]
MDILDCARIILDRVLKFDPENARKVVGYLLMQNLSEPEMARLASCPDQIMAEVVLNAKIQMLAVTSAMTSPPPNVAPPRGLAYFPGFSPSSPPPPPTPRNFQGPSTYWDLQSSASNENQEFMGVSYLDSVTELQKQAQMLSLENHLDHVNTRPRGVFVNDYNNGFDSSVVNFGGRSAKRFSNSNPSEFPVKICHYFSKGYCRHGGNCRYFHGQVPHESLSSQIHMHGNGDNEDQVISPRSLAQIESEIIELLKQKRGNPMSIASLPMAYFERYKKALQAQGYLTESQRHGKSGYSLTRLLARLNGIRLIDRPHGQHAVILAEDAPKYIQTRDLVQNISASRQIYMTFPADSTFSEDDVASYFNEIGPVDDVRIPCQHKRMFGFVTFAHPETVRIILEKGNPHFVRGSRVLVKPYRENTRRYQDRVEHFPCCPRYYTNMDSEFDLIQRELGPRELGKHRSMMRRQRMEEAQAFEHHKRSLEQLQLSQRVLPVSDRFNFQPVEVLNYTSNDVSKVAETDSSEGSNEVHVPHPPKVPHFPDEFPIENNN